MLTELYVEALLADRDLDQIDTKRRDMRAVSLGHCWQDSQMNCQCDLWDLVEAARPPDAELVDLIEWAFLEGQIDGQKADLAYFWVYQWKDFSPSRSP